MRVEGEWNLCRLCPVTVFGISGVEPLGSAARNLVKLEKGLTDIGNGRWMELAHDCVRW